MRRPVGHTDQRSDLHECLIVLSARKKAYKQMSIDAESVYELIESYNGILPFTDKSAPELIRLETGLTKNAFKRAVGHLLKEGKIQIKTDTIELTGGK